jgi:hypothetical protein
VSILFNNFTNNANIATKFEEDLLHCVTNVKERTAVQISLLYVGIIKEMPGSVASGTPCMFGSL